VVVPDRAVAVQPTDVFQLLTTVSSEVRWLSGLIIAMSAVCAVLVMMVIFQVVAKYLIFRWVVSVLREVHNQVLRTERLLDMAEAHGRISDSQKERSAQMLDETQKALHSVVKQAGQAVTQAAQAAKVTATQVAERVVERVGELVGLPAHAITPGPDSGKIRTVNPPMPQPPPAGA